MEQINLNLDIEKVETKAFDLSNREVVPPFEVFSDSENISHVFFDEVDAKWKAFYKPDQLTR